ncbi:MAG: hypothetical protein JSV36_05570 [Anaerolineae bacterium]|nr:MAG: hypothetical protein JSV36_05570 [Anaerolineae bacterium]
MLFDPQTPGTEFVLAAVKARQDRWLQEAEVNRLTRPLRVARPGLLRRVLAAVGNLLIAAGKRLQERHTPAMTQSAGVYQSRC